MVLFSCFPAHIPCHKPKKVFQYSAECMHKKAQDHSQELVSGGSSHSPTSDATHARLSKNPCASSHAEKLTRSSSFHMPVTASAVMSPDPKLVSGSSFEESVHIHSSKVDSSHALCLKKRLHTSCLKKSKSLGSALDRKGRFVDVCDTEDEIDQGLSCENIHEVNPPRTFSTIDHNDSAESSENKERENVLDDLSGFSQHDEDAQNVEPCKMHMGSNQDDRCVYVDESNTSEKNVIMRPSYSTDIEDNRRRAKTTLGQRPAGSRSRSYGDLLALELSEQAFVDDNSGYCSQPASLKSGNVSLPNVSDAVSLTRHQHMFEEKAEDCANSVQSDNSGIVIGHIEGHTDGGNFDAQNQLHDGRSASSLKDDMIIQEISTENMEKLENEDTQTHDCKRYPRNWWDGLSSEEFNLKRIEHWVNTIDIENCNSSDEVGECSTASPEAKEDSTETGGSSGKLDSRIQHVVQVANRYISTLGTSSASAQMANFGLPVIPQLSIFHSLRVVNLSGNAIVRIAAGALPKGLHVLNLSKNYISTIEGLRELTRLRVLDLSYNRIFRIGRGLASCASLKELYLAGNKISEVEGLHRLLKLNILDLSYNKISTAKCLGQLAANYSSLQVLNMEGNPAQKNVGDEQLKKSLMSLLPQLVYLNRQPVKASSSKEASDRASRSVSMHQFERGARSDHKIARKASHSSLIKASGNGALIQAVTSSKQSKGHLHGRLPPSRSKVTHHQVNPDSRLIGLQLTSSMRRSRSEGTMNIL
ncbi:uncharacterized protein LOC116259186 [Nymphaea colorata]|nr:uncharacterized protein LOC116259186 [Nymphaea colorata]XP_031492737.1 uncharacterized protein LOC116259186 [Nymphaea colorata]